jgi:hypothetical protein
MHDPPIPPRELKPLTAACTPSMAVFKERPATLLGALVPTLIAGFDEEHAVLARATDAGPAAADAVAEPTKVTSAIKLTTAVRCNFPVRIERGPPIDAPDGANLTVMLNAALQPGKAR